MILREIITSKDDCSSFDKFSLDFTLPFNKKIQKYESIKDAIDLVEDFNIMNLR